jgi:hypothetical protein
MDTWLVELLYQYVMNIKGADCQFYLTVHLTLLTLVHQLENVGLL